MFGPAALRSLAISTFLAPSGVPLHFRVCNPKHMPRSRTYKVNIPKK